MHGEVWQSCWTCLSCPALRCHHHPSYFRAVLFISRMVVQSCPARCKNNLGLSGLRTLHPTCSRHCAAVLLPLQQIPLFWRGSIGSSNFRHLYSSPLPVYPWPSEPDLVLFLLPLHFSSLISTSSLPHLSFQTVTSCFLQSQPSFLFLVLSFNLSTWCSVTTCLYLSIEHWLLVILAPASWRKSCHKVTLRIKLNFSAIFFFLANRWIFCCFVCFKKNVRTAPPASHSTFPAVAQDQHSSLKQSWNIW